MDSDGVAPAAPAPAPTNGRRILPALPLQTAIPKSFRDETLAKLKSNQGWEKFLEGRPDGHALKDRVTKTQHVAAEQFNIRRVSIIRPQIEAAVASLVRVLQLLVALVNLTGIGPLPMPDGSWGFKIFTDGRRVGKQAPIEAMHLSPLSKLPKLPNSGAGAAKLPAPALS